MSVQPGSVDEFLARMNHPRRAEIDAIRHLIAAIRPTLVEHVKWNAPSFTDNGEDRITFRLQPNDRVELVLHRGAKRRSDPFEFTDPTGLVVWATSDRGVVTIPDRSFIDRHHDQLQQLTAAWIEATTDR